jgi:6-phosphogluconolactonase
MNVHITDAGSDFARIATDVIAKHMRHAIRTHGDCIIGLSGGSTPRPVYELLADEAIDWTRVTVFLVDDRCVSSDHPDSNQYLIVSSLLKKAAGAKAVFHDTSLPPEDAAKDYGERLTAMFTRPADIVVLGMGRDGHIASLFPPLTKDAFGPAAAIHTTTDVFAVHDRISVTLPVLASAAHAIFLFKGADKSAVWEEMMASDEDVRRWPAKAVTEGGHAEVIKGE